MTPAAPPRRSQHDPTTKEEAAGSHGAGDRQGHRLAFKAANRKGDGRLTLQEYVNALFIDFDKADTDKDGSLTFEEIEVYSRTIGR